MTLRETFEAAEIHDRWESVYRGSPLQDRLNDRMLERFLGRIRPSPDARFLDAGCGTADHAMRLAAKGFHCVGADVSESVLQRAAENIRKRGLDERVELCQEALENLSFADGTFDVVHCRGVLMHIPEWQKGLANLCRVLKPGGYVLILESNHRALEAVMVRLVRRFRKSLSTMVETPGGVEFWSTEQGQPFVRRVANVRFLISELEKNHIRVLERWPAEFWDINLFPPGLLRNSVIRFNRLWFELRGPALLSSGLALLGQKAKSD